MFSVDNYNGYSFMIILVYHKKKKIIYFRYFLSLRSATKNEIFYVLRTSVIAKLCNFIMFYHALSNFILILYFTGLVFLYFM